jgi:uncharacterized membrane protein YesL
VLWEFLRDAYDDFYKLVIFNLLWVITTVPVVTAPAAAAGIYFAANQMAHHEQVDWRTFFEGFRRYWRLGLRWIVVNLVAIALLVFNFWFYSQYPAQWAPWARGLFLGILVLWVLLQVYTFPMLFEQKDRRMRTALRNSAVLYLKRPGLVIGTTLFLAVLLAVSTIIVIPWFLFTAGIFVYLATRVAVFVVNEVTAAGAPPRPVD